jgi:hypothetical protein
VQLLTLIQLNLHPFRYSFPILTYMQHVLYIPSSLMSSL